MVTAPPLLTALDCVGHVHLILGTGPLAAARVSKSLQVGALPTVIGPADDQVHYSLNGLVEEGAVRWIQREFEEDDVRRLGRAEVENVVDAVFVTAGPKSPLSGQVSTLCRRLRIPVNVVDAPDLCSFTLLSTHSDGPLQIGISTSGMGCKLSWRIRREIAAALPHRFGQTVELLGTLRRRILDEDPAAEPTTDSAFDVEDGEPPNQKHTFNALVLPVDDSTAEARHRRLRWLSQICEYWPLSRLATTTEADICAILASDPNSALDAVLNAGNKSSRGTITLAGSGPGHPDLLTRATHGAIQNASFILADKLVPAAVLELIPRRTPVHIARKFPGNADAAQEELLSLGLDALVKGQNVLRLKQGDPYLYGRGAEEVDFFRRHGYEPQVLPGVTSALSAPLFAGIPVTHRSVADQVLICTGTGRKGAAPDPPSYQPALTVVFLMALHRLESLVASLTSEATAAGPVGEGTSLLTAVSSSLPSPPLSSDSTTTTTQTQPSPPSPPHAHQTHYKPWPSSTPCAIIERASCPDQRVIRTTLQHAVQAVVEEGSRPPGLLLLGAVATVLHPITPKAGQKPEASRWVVEEGLGR